MTSIIEKSFDTAQTYEWYTGCDTYRTVFVVPSGNATYNIEVSNGGNAWFQAPGADHSNPVSNAVTIASHECAWQKTRLRITSLDAPVTLQYAAAELAR